MTMADKLRSLPPVPEDRGNVVARLDAVEARNAVLIEALANFCEAWQMLRGEAPPEIEEVIKACRVPKAA